MRPFLPDPLDLTTADGAAEFEARLRRRLVGQVFELRLILHGHGVILRGSARTYYAKQLAQHAVMEATSVPIVANEIEVS